MPFKCLEAGLSWPFARYALKTSSYIALRFLPLKLSLPTEPNEYPLSNVHRYHHPGKSCVFQGGGTRVSKGSTKGFEPPGKFGNR